MLVAGAGPKPRGETSIKLVRTKARLMRLPQLVSTDKLTSQTCSKRDIREQWFTETLSIRCHQWHTPLEWSTNSLFQWIMGNGFRLLSAFDIRFILMGNMEKGCKTKKEKNPFFILNETIWQTRHWFVFSHFLNENISIYPPWKTLMFTHHIIDTQILKRSIFAVLPTENNQI